MTEVYERDEQSICLATSYVRSVAQDTANFCSADAIVLCYGSMVILQTQLVYIFIYISCLGRGLFPPSSFLHILTAEIKHVAVS